MADKQKIWSTVGSAGILDHVDLPKVSLHRSIIQLGISIDSSAPTTLEATAPTAAGLLGPGFPTMQAVVRYNVTAVDGLFFPPPPSPRLHYALQLRFMGRVTAKLREVDVSNGSENDLVVFQSSGPSSVFQLKQTVAEDFVGNLDFVKKAYYVEATLVAPAFMVGHPAAISAIQLFAALPKH
jgi:hypothetical protein